MKTRWKVSGLCGTRNCTCVLISVVELVWADCPKFLGNVYASHVVWVGCWPTRQSCYRCGAPRQGWNGGQRLQRESHYPGQPSNQGLPNNPAKRVLRGFKGGNGQSPLNVAPTAPAPTSGNGLADPAVLLPLLQSLGLPVEVMVVVRARVAPQKTPKKVSRRKELSLHRAKIDVLDQQITRLNKSVLFHHEKVERK